MNCKVWLDDKENYIIEQYQSGRTANNIAREFNVTNKRITNMLRKYNVEVRQDNNQYKSLPYHSQIIDMHKNGMSIKQIRRELNLSEPTLRKVARKYNLDFTKNYKWKKPHIYKKEEISFFTKIDGEKALEKYIPAVRNINRVYDPKYYIDENIFEKINTEDKAYILGLLYADGNVMVDKIRLSMIDLDIINKVKNSVNCNNKIYVIKPRSIKNKIQYCLSISRKKIVSDIIKLGCVPKKSLILKFPDENILPTNLTHHFIRGYFDGDGSLHHSKDGKWIIQIVGTKEFLSGILYYTKCEAYWSKRHKDDKNNFCIAICKKSQAVKFLSYIYKDSKIYLDRKYNKYQECVHSDNYKDYFYSPFINDEISLWLNELGLFTNIKNGIIHGEEKSIAIHYCDFKTQLKADPKYNYKLHKEYLDNGINLFTIFEDEWVYRKEQVKNFITAKLGIFKRKIYARQCEIKEVDKQTAAQFISNNHIQPTNNGGLINFGLFNNEELLGLVQLRTHHRNNLDITISRICFLSSFLIIGGFSRLVKHTFRWCEQNGYKRLITWSDNRWTTGQSYINSGFIKYKDLPSDYSYIRENEQNRKSKQSMSKDKIGCPKNIGEREWTSNMGYSRIWDCGKIAFVYNI